MIVFSEFPLIFLRFSFALGVSLSIMGATDREVLSSLALADQGASCHFHGDKIASEATLLDCASKRIEKLIAQKKIESLWQGVPHDSISQVQGKNGKEWRLVFKNLNAQDKAKENLYLFFSLNGNFIAANFTGK